MRYNQAAFIGQQRSKEAQIKLFDFTGFAMLTYTIKKRNDGSFIPVGEDIQVALMKYNDQAIIYFTDEDGFAKAQSKPLEINTAEDILKKIKANGFKEFEGEIKTI